MRTATGQTAAPRRLHALAALVLAAAVAGCATPAGSGSPTVAAEQDLVAPPAYAVRTAGRITLDGRFDEPAWADAPTVEMGFSPSLRRASRLVGHAKFLWDDTCLYVALWAEDEDIFSHFTQRDDPLWNEDVLELFLKPRPDHLGYYEFQFNPRGAVFDAFWPSRGRLSEALHAAVWNSHADVAVTIDGTLNAWNDRDRLWQAEVRIPWADFAEVRGTTGPPAAGEQWRCTATVYDFSAYHDERYLAASAPLKYSFHQYEYWGPLTFVTEAPKQP